MAVIKMKNLRVRTIIGAFDFERNIHQDLVINLKIHFDDTKAAASDELSDTVDYKKLKRRVIDLVESSSYHLLEALSEKILDVIMEDPLVVKVKVEIDKPGALRFVDSVSLSKKRER